MYEYKVLPVTVHHVGGACPQFSGGQINGYTTKSYYKMALSDNVVNPARGFYHTSATKTSSFAKLSATTIPDQGDYNVVLRLYYLDTYVTSELDHVIIDNIRNDLNIAQSKGWSVLLRFAYTKNYTILHDAPLSKVLSHINSLKHGRIFQDFEGIIVAIQAGFIGNWGEWHTTNSDFGNIGSCKHLQLTDSQWDARKQVLQALLYSAPKSIEVLVRRPIFKYHIFGETYTTLSADRSQSDMSRIGFHDDALMSDERDMGTFLCDNDRTFLTNDSVYNLVAGETDSAKYPNFYSCDNAKHVLGIYHYTTVNHDYLTAVIEYWRKEGCLDEIAARLGYRLFLTKAILPDTVAAGSEFCYDIHLGNDGYAAPMKPFIAKIVLKHTDGSEYPYVVPHVDVRTWQPGVDIGLQGSFSTDNVKAGTYKTYLVLSLEKMSTNNKYNVLLANTDVQVTSSRRNDLQHNTVVSGHGTGTGGSTTGGDGTGHGTGGFLLGGLGSHCHAQLADGSFESGSGWHNYHDGFSTHSSHSPENGHHYITVSNGGAYQDIDFTQSPVTSFALSGYGRAHSSVSVSGSDYSIYCDITYTDGDTDWGKTVNFDPSQKTWVKKTLVVVGSKTISSARCYAMFRNGSGRVDFDNFKLEHCS